MAIDPTGSKRNSPHAGNGGDGTRLGRATATASALQVNEPLTGAKNSL